MFVKKRCMTRGTEWNILVRHVEQSRNTRNNCKQHGTLRKWNIGIERGTFCLAHEKSVGTHKTLEEPMALGPLVEHMGHWWNTWVTGGTHGTLVEHTARGFWKH